MSRFFASNYEYEGTSSSSEEDLLSGSEDESLLGSSSEGEQSDDSLFNEESELDSDVDSDDSDSKPYGPDWFKKPEFRRSGGGGSGANKFLKGAHYSDDDSSEEEEGRKIVKSAREKLLDEMLTVHNKIEIAEMSDDWISVVTDFENMLRLLVRAQQQNFGIPNVFVKVLALIEDAVNAKGQDDSMNKAVARAFNTMRQRIKKIVREHDEIMQKYREDPELFEDNLASTMPVGSADAAASAAQIGATAKAPTLSSLATASSEVSFMASLRIVMDSRGKKSVDSQILIKTLEELLNIAKNPYESIMAYLTLIPTRFDASVNLAYQPIEHWKRAYDDMVNLLNILDENKSTYVVTELAQFNEFIEDEPKANENGLIQILGSLFSYVERLDDEFTKSLLNSDPHSSDYLERLRDEQKIYNLILRTQLYLESTTPDEEKIRLLTRPFIKRLDHIYYKPIKLSQAIETTAWKQLPNDLNSSYIPFKGEASEDYITELVQTLTELLKKNDDIAIKKRATLYQVYYHALNKDFEESKNMLLESNVQQNINKAEPSLQILFNRVVVQLGLSAFKLSLIEDCHQILNELLSATHLRELLGQQTLQRLSSHSSFSSDDKTKLCLPYHQHINLDLIDLVFMTCSLLIEIPQMAAFYSGIKVQRIPYSPKSVRRALEHYDKSTFQGPPETLRDTVIFAAKEMKKGNWSKCLEYLTSIKTWALLPNMRTIFEVLTTRVKEETLKTYFFSYKRFYANFGVKKLADLVSLPESTVIEVLEKTVSEYDVEARFNDDRSALTIIKGDEITKLEEIAIKLNKEVKIAKDRLKPHYRR